MPRATRHCRDDNRLRPYDGPDAFTFLGYTFRGRSQQNRHGQLYTGFAPAISDDALAAKGDVVRSWRLHRKTTLTLKELAELVNQSVRSWMHYYGRYNRARMYPLLARINHYIQQWMRKKYKRLRKLRAMLKVWERLLGQYPGTFAHWQWVTSDWW